jgi:hypothetical protein
MVGWRDLAAAVRGLVVVAAGHLAGLGPRGVSLGSGLAGAYRSLGGGLGRGMHSLGAAAFECAIE